MKHVFFLAILALAFGCSPEPEGPSGCKFSNESNLVGKKWQNENFGMLRYNADGTFEQSDWKVRDSLVFGGTYVFTGCDSLKITEADGQRYSILTLGEVGPEKMTLQVPVWGELDFLIVK